MVCGLTEANGAKARRRVAPLFVDWPELLVRSALEGCMGHVWLLGDAAACEVGDFLFLAGEAEGCGTLARRFAADGRFHILASRTEALHKAAGEALGARARPGERYAFHKGGESFDRSALSQMARSLPKGVTLRLFDGALYRAALESEWSRDFVSLFASETDYLAHGLGVAAVCGGELVGGASSYAYCPGGIEIELDTREDWRRRGVARACAARLILECLARGLYPSWDAANRVSAHLARTLGYREAGAYPVWFLKPDEGEQKHAAAHEASQDCAG